MGNPSGQEQFEVLFLQDLLEMSSIPDGNGGPHISPLVFANPREAGGGSGLLRECLISQEKPSELCGGEPEQWKPGLMDPALESPGWKVRKWKVKGESLRGGKFMEHQNLWLEF